MQVKFRSGSVIDYASMLDREDRRENETFIEYLKRNNYLIKYSKNKHIHR